jgi:hypothetical protein
MVKIYPIFDEVTDKSDNFDEVIFDEGSFDEGPPITTSI